MSNRLVYVDREYISPNIEGGLALGGRVHVIARSPDHVLVWVGGHSWSINGHQRYAEPTMMMFDREWQSTRGYKRVQDGGRLSKSMILMLKDKLGSFGAEDIFYSLIGAVGRRETLLVEGGGTPLMPDGYRDRAAYERWRDLPIDERGLTKPQTRKEWDRRSLGWTMHKGD